MMRPNNNKTEVITALNSIKTNEAKNNTKLQSLITNLINIDSKYMWREISDMEPRSAAIRIIEKAIKGKLRLNSLEYKAIYFVV